MGAESVLEVPCILNVPHLVFNIIVVKQYITVTITIWQKKKESPHYPWVGSQMGSGVIFYVLGCKKKRNKFLIPELYIKPQIAQSSMAMLSFYVVLRKTEHFQLHYFYCECFLFIFMFLSTLYFSQYFLSLF